MNKYDNYPFPELQLLVTKMEKDLDRLKQEFAKFQHQERSEVVRLELEKSKTPATDPTFNQKSNAWLQRRQQSEMAIRKMQENLRNLERELQYAREALDRKIQAQQAQ